MQIDTISVCGFKSIEKLSDFKLDDINVFIGPNGAGKTNFLSTFRFLSDMSRQQLQGSVKRIGGPDRVLSGGRKQTSRLMLELKFRRRGEFQNGYRVSLTPSAENRLFFDNEETWVKGRLTSNQGSYTSLGRYHDEAKLSVDDKSVSHYVCLAMKGWRQFHFHDTSSSAKVKQIQSASDTMGLKEDAANLAAFLRFLSIQYKDFLCRIEETIRLVAPFFGCFVFRPLQDDLVQLEWTQRHDPDTPYNAHALSDGTLRFICLTVLLLQPDSFMPSVIIIDEPELGLHPYAIGVLADLLKSAAETKQIIVSTQSIELINAFSANNIIVAKYTSGQTVLDRLDEKDLDVWLQDEYIGDLWKRNIFGGNP